MIQMMWDGVNNAVGDGSNDDDGDDDDDKG